MLTDILITILAIGADQAVKYWAVTVLSGMPGGVLPVFQGVFDFVYAENTGADVSFLRGRSAVMLIVRIIEIAVALYLLIKKRDKLAKITRFALCLFIAGMIGNQINYLLFDFVPDMLYLPFLNGVIFNVADIWSFAAMIILFIRLAFYEGRDLVDYLSKKLGKKGRETPKEHSEEISRISDGTGGAASGQGTPAPPEQDTAGKPEDRNV